MLILRWILPKITHNQKSTRRFIKNRRVFMVCVSIKRAAASLFDAFGIFGLEIPCVGTHLINVIFRFPAKFCLSFCGIAIAGGNITSQRHGQYPVHYSQHRCRYYRLQYLWYRVFSLQHTDALSPSQRHGHSHGYRCRLWYRNRRRKR